jgi:hypothetical protein
MRFILVSLFLALGLGAAAAARADEASLRISFAGKTFTFNAAALAALPHQDISATDAHEKKTHLYSGVLVRDLLTRAGVPGGEQLRGHALRLAVVARATDHYDVVFALAEFEPAFSSRPILLVDRQDGLPLPGALGPLRLVIPGDLRPARWERMIVALDVIPVGDGS